MHKFVTWLKTSSIIYLFIYLSFILVGFIDFIYMNIIWFRGDVWPFYSFILYLLWWLVASFLSLIFYKITFFIFSITKKISPFMLVVWLASLWVIQMWIWYYWDKLKLIWLLESGSFFEFWFYYPECMWLIAHAIFYIFAWLFIRYKSIFIKNVSIKN